MYKNDLYQVSLIYIWVQHEQDRAQNETQAMWGFIYTLSLLLTHPQSKSSSVDLIIVTAITPNKMLNHSAVP